MKKEFLIALKAFVITILVVGAGCLFLAGCNEVPQTTNTAPNNPLQSIGNPDVRDDVLVELRQTLVAVCINGHVYLADTVHGGVAIAPLYAPASGPNYPAKCSKDDVSFPISGSN